MNERLQQLADQAEKYADNNFKGESGYSEAFDSKFAELIVRECLRICQEGTATQTTCAGAADLIKQHFGVEQ